MKSILYYIYESNSDRYKKLIDVLNQLTIDNKYLSVKNENIIKDLYNLKQISINLELYKNDKYVMLAMIESNGVGAGTTFMTDLCDWADNNDKILTLSPTDMFVGNRNYNRLVKFYKRFDFREIKSARTNFKTHQTMIRIPR